MGRRTVTACFHLPDGVMEVMEAKNVVLEVMWSAVPYFLLLGVVGQTRHMIKFQFFEKLYFRLPGNVSFLNVSAVRFAFVHCVAAQFS